MVNQSDDMDGTAHFIRTIRQIGAYSTVFLKFMSQSAPYQTIRTFYSELYKQLFWGVPLRGMMGTQEVINDIYRPYHQSMLNYLKVPNAEGFAAILEEASNLAVQFVSER